MSFTESLEEQLRARFGEPTDGGEGQSTASASPPEPPSDPPAPTGEHDYEVPPPAEPAPPVPDSWDDIDIPLELDGQDTVEGVEPPVVDGTTTEAPPATDATLPDDIDLNALTEQLYGRRLTQAEMQNLFQVANDLNSLDEDRRVELGRLLYPDTQPQPQPQAPPAVGTQGGYQYQPPADQYPEIPTALDEDYPEVAAALRSQQAQLQQQIAQIQATQSEQQQRAYQENMRQTEAAARAAGDEWRKAHPEISTEEYTAMAVRGGAGNYANIYAQQGHDPKTAMYMGLDAAFWNSPEFRERQIQAEMERRTQQTQQTLSKKRKAAAVSSSGGPVTHDAPRTTFDNDMDRRSAMSQALKQMGQENVTSPPG